MVLFNSFVVKLELRLDPDGLYRITKQTDFYQPEVSQELKIYDPLESNPFTHITDGSNFLTL